MAESIIVIKNTAPKYLKGVSDQTIRKRVILALLREGGRMKFNEDGRDLNWNVCVREPEMRQNGDSGQIIFNEHDANEQLTLDWRGYYASDKLTKKKQLMNKGPLAIVDLFGTKLEALTTKLRNGMGKEIYIDGNAANNDNRIHGLESFLGDDGATVVGDRVARPSDTYAGKSTVLGTFGGTWTTDLGVGNYPNATIAKDWPEGSGDSEYDAISPKLLNYTSTAWPSGAATWRDNSLEVMRRGKTWTQTLSGDEDAPYLHLLSGKMFNDFQDRLDARFRVIVPHKRGQDLGFDSVLDFEGSMVKHEFECPANTGYGINISEMMLSSLTPELFFMEGPEWDLESLSYLYLVGFFGNARFNPKAFCKYKNYA